MVLLEKRFVFYQTGNKREINILLFSQNLYHFIFYNTIWGKDAKALFT